MLNSASIRAAAAGIVLAAPATAAPTCADLLATTRALGTAVAAMAAAAETALDVHMSLTGGNPDFAAETTTFLADGLTPMADALAASHAPMRAAQARYDAACPG